MCICKVYNESCKECDWILDCKIAKNSNKKPVRSISISELINELLTIPNQNKVITSNTLVGDLFIEDSLNTNKVLTDNSPLQIGQKVWLPYIYGDAAREGYISSIAQKADKTWEFEVTHNSYIDNFTLTDIGSKVFLSRTAARQNVLKLKENLNI